MKIQTLAAILLSTTFAISTSYAADDAMPTTGDTMSQTASTNMDKATDTADTAKKHAKKHKKHKKHHHKKNAHAATPAEPATPATPAEPAAN